MRHGLTDKQWQAIEDLFPEPAATGRPPANPRQMLEAMIWINNTGAKWRDLPRELGAWQTVFKHFDRWNGDGTLQVVVTRLTQLAIERPFNRCQAPMALSCPIHWDRRTYLPVTRQARTIETRFGTVIYCRWIYQNEWFFVRDVAAMDLRLAR